MADNKIRQDQAHRLYIEGQVSALRTICSILIEEINPSGDLKRRVGERLAIHSRGLQAFWDDPTDPSPLPSEDFRDGAISVLDSFVDLLLSRG